MKLKFIFCMIWLCSLTGLYSQTLDIKPSLQLKGKYKSNKLWLRWVVYDQNQWYVGLTQGYVLKKYLITNEKKSLEWSKLIKPTTKSAWIRSTDSLSVEETMYDLLYLSNKELIDEMPQKADGSNYEYSTDEIKETRYLLSFWAANHHFQASLLQGIGYEDPDINRNQSYEYVLISNKDSSSLKFDPKSSVPAILPIRPEYHLDEVRTYLQWESKSRFDTYHSYQIEISSEGNHFLSLTSDQVNNYVDTKTEKGYRQYYYWQDSIYPGEMRWYRLRGMDYFGELNSPGPPLQIQYTTRIPSPLAIDYEQMDPGVRLNWFFQNDFESEISHFQIWVSDSIHGEKKLIQDHILRSQRTYDLASPAVTLFYYITLIRLGGGALSSFPIMVTPIDREPPTQPIHLSGHCDSTGKVFLFWPKHPAIDLEGYRVFKANAIHDEFSQVTVDLQNDTFYVDTIDLNNLNNFIYYKIAAEDHRGNMSTLSIPVAIMKYDTIAPTSPQIYRWSPEESSIKIDWYPSTSTDLKNTKLFRKQPGQSEWELLKLINSSQHENSFLDEEIQPDSVYIYSLVSEDQSGNLSEESEQVVARALGQLKFPPIESIEITYDSTTVNALLSWEYLVDPVSEYWIYKSEGNQPLTLQLTLDASIHSWVDSNLIKGKNYTYRIKALMQNGRDSYFSKAIILYTR